MVKLIISSFERFRSCFLSRINVPIDQIYTPLLGWQYLLSQLALVHPSDHVRYLAMASSPSTTSIPLQEPVFRHFLHDVHHAYLLLHRAMALLPPTMIPNIEPTPLPSTGVWNQPEGLQPAYSESTNAFIDDVNFPPPDLEEEEAFMDDLMQYNLPQPHQHVAAPPPDALPDPSKLSSTAATPTKRKQKAKATPKAPAKRRRTLNTFALTKPFDYLDYGRKQKLRTLKSDEKSRFSWRVISTKMGKTETDVRSMWNQIKDTLG